MKLFCGVLFLLVNICFVHHLDGSAQETPVVPPAALNALEELYNSTNGPNWFYNYNWMSAYSPCDAYNGWYGVYCSGANYNQLALSDNRLDGTLPSSIFTDIPYLYDLYLSYNTLSGTLPDSIGYTAVRDQIVLNRNQLTGSLPDTFVAHDTDDSVYNYPNLYLSNNQLTGTIPPSFSIVDEYAQFEINSNYFFCPFPKYCDECCSECGNCYQPIEQVEIDSLTSFYKDTNGPEWKQSTNWLNGNPCPDDPNLQWFGVVCGFDRKTHQQHILNMNLVNNGLQGQFTLDSLSGLIELDLSQNNFDRSPLPDLSDSLKLQALELSQNNFTGTIPSSYENFLYLEALNLSSNSLTGVLPRSVCGSYYLNLTGNDWTCPFPLCCDQATPPGNEPCGSCS